MHHVYMLESLSKASERYVGLAQSIPDRLAEHNAGKSSHTSKYRPWRVVSYIALTDREEAVVFERYLKSGSGRAFARTRLW